MGMIGNSLAQGLISGANIQDGTVDTPDIKDGAIHTAKVADDAVHTAKIADDAVHTAKIADGAVTAAKIADGAAVPAQTGQSGNYLTTDGTTASWSPVDLNSRVDKTGDTMTGALSVETTDGVNPSVVASNAADGPAFSIKHPARGGDFELHCSGTNSENFLLHDNQRGHNLLLAGTEGHEFHANNARQAKLRADGPMYIVGPDDRPDRFNHGVLANNRRGVLANGPVLPSNAWVYDTSGNNTGWIFDTTVEGFHYQSAGDANGMYGTVSVSKAFYNGAGGGTYNIAEFCTNYGWNGGWMLIELFTQGYYASGYRRGVIEGGYAAGYLGELTSYTHGTQFGSISVTTTGSFADGTTGTSSNAVDQSYHRHTVQIVGSSYGSMVAKITFLVGWPVVASTNGDAQVRLY